MRSYLVVIDETSEARAALRYAARRASGTGGGVILLAIIPPAEFVQWGGVQAAMEEEAKLRAEAMVLQASGAIVEEAGIEPTILVRQGEPEKAIADLLAERDDVAALVLGAAAEGGPGPARQPFLRRGRRKPALPAGHRPRPPRRRGSGPAELKTILPRISGEGDRRSAVEGSSDLEGPSTRLRRVPLPANAGRIEGLAPLAGPRRRRRLHRAADHRLA